MIFPSNRVRIMVATKPIDFRKAHDIKFRVGGLITWVSGKQEQNRRVSEGAVMQGIRLVKSETTGAYDLKDGDWTVFGLDKNAIKIIG